MTQEKKGPEYCCLWYSRVDCSFFGFFSTNNNLRFSFGRKFFSQLLIEPLTLYSSSLLSNLLCGTVSKAFEKSRIATSVCMAASCDFRKSCNRTNSWVSQEWPDLNPWLSDVRTLYFSRCFNMCLQMMCSSSLHGIDVNDTGL